MTFSATSFVSTLEFRVYYRLFSRGFSINPSVQKLWREKSNRQMSSYGSRPVSARFEYIGRYLQEAQSLFSPLYTSWMPLWCLLQYSLAKVAFGGTAANLRSLSREWKFLKLLKGLTVGQAVLEIPLSEGSKLELHCTSQILARFPYTSPYTHAFVRVCTCIMPCVYISCTLYIQCTRRGFCTLVPSLELCYVCTPTFTATIANMGQL